MEWIGAVWQSVARYGRQGMVSRGTVMCGVARRCWVWQVWNERRKENGL